MDNLIKLVRLYMEEANNYNRLNSMIIKGLKESCSDLMGINLLLDSMNNFNDIQFKYISFKDSLEETKDIINVILYIKESSTYLGDSTKAFNNLINASNDSIEQFNKLINKVKNNSDYIGNLMDTLLRMYLVNIDENSQDKYINSIDENELDKVLSSLRRIVSNKPDDVETKKLIDKLLNKKVDLMSTNNNQEEKVTIK